MDKPEELLDASVIGSKVGYVVAGLDAGANAIEGKGFAFDNDAAPCVREGDLRRDRCTPHSISVDATVATLAAFMFRVVEVDSFSCFERCIVKSWLITIDPEDVVASLADDELGPLSLGMHRICCDDRAGKVEWLEQWSKSEDLVRLVIFYIALCDHHPGIVTKSAKQLDLSAVRSPGSSNCLAINSDPYQFCSHAIAIAIAVGVFGVITLSPLLPAIALLRGPSVDDKVKLVWINRHRSTPDRSVARWYPES